MIAKIQLTKAERKVIRKALKIQIDNLTELIEKDSEEDVEMFCILNGIDQNEFKSYHINLRDEYISIWENPETFLSLSNPRLGIIRHILMNFLNHKKYLEPKISIWRKMNLKEDLTFKLN